MSSPDERTRCMTQCASGAAARDWHLAATVTAAFCYLASVLCHTFVSVTCDTCCHCLNLGVVCNKLQLLASYQWFKTAAAAAFHTLDNDTFERCIPHAWL